MPLQPRIIVSANCSVEGSKVINYKPLLDAAIELSSHKPEKCIIYNRKYESVSRIMLNINVQFLNSSVPAPLLHEEYAIYFFLNEEHGKNF